MSDRSFGDFSTRNVVKNPLLSSAVIGLSIDDLTQNAVLLPAIPSQELITRQDQKPDEQTHAHEPPKPAGDADTHTDASDPRHMFNNDHSNAQSKAASKPDDDFDVKEYFARLQGSRYVSAPFNTIKEGKNIPEDNLEEINLNEPDKAQSVDEDVVQQSLTADIAQNFSQLPTVLPQVASAVFSSFSNMLSMKSREQTPDGRSGQEQHVSSVQDVQHVQQHVAPPPLKEPPTAGIASSYRITTKKKVYAPIPGLSSGDGHVHFNPQANALNPPLNSAPFIAESANIYNIQQNENQVDNASIAVGNQYSVFTPENVPESDSASKYTIQETDINIENTSIAFDNQYSMLTQQTIAERQHVDKEKAQDTFNETSSAFEGSNETVKQTNDFVPIQDNQGLTQLQPIQNQQPTAAIIPPPPMFSNLPRRDSQTSAKSVLPPSVARRISANHPIIKSQAPPSVIKHENLFVPKLPPEPNVGPTFGFESAQPNYGQSFDLTSNIGSVNRPQTDTQILQPMLQPTSQSNFAPTNVGLLATIPILEPKESTLSTESFIQTQPKPADTFVSPSIFNPANEMLNVSSNPEANVSHKTSPEIIPPPPTFYNPTQAGFTVNNEPKDIPSVQHSQIPFANLPAEPPKAIVEPPKFTGNLNYRMSKRRPQYYSGPIEGVGSISNNIKPIINPVEASSFQGALFTPDQNIAAASSTLYSDYSTSVQEPAPFDISQPASIEPYPTHVSQQAVPIQQDYNTAFDLSRPTTEKYEHTQQHTQPQTQQENRGFGIIGSLKSKLSSIDINKIQNTVTTFFDPAYNTTVEGNKPENSFSYQNIPGSYPNYPQNEGTTLEVFVPEVSQEQVASNPYSYQTGHPQPVDLTKQYYPTQDYYGNENQSQMYPNYYTGWYNYNQQSQETYQTSTNIQENIVESNIVAESKTIEEIKPPSNISTYLPQDNVSHSINLDSQKQIPIARPEVTGSSTSFFDSQKEQVVPGLPTEKLKDDIFKFDQHHPKVDLKPSQLTSDSTLKSFFDAPKVDFLPEAAMKPATNMPLKLSNDEVLQPSAHSSLSIFDKPLPMTGTKDISSKMDNIRGGYGSDFISDVPKISQVFNDPPSKGFFDKQTSLVLPFAIKNPDDIKLGHKDESKREFAKSQTEFIKPVDDFSVIKKPDVIIPEPVLPIVTAKSLDRRTDNLSSMKNLQSNDFNQNTFSLFESSPNASVPLFNVSSLSAIGVPDTVKDNDVKDIQTKLESISLFQNNEAPIDSQPTYNLFGTVEIKDELESQVSDLNICETCREVNKPEEREVEDLTTQLIENITAPIQLANPVEFPIKEEETNTDTELDYAPQLDEMSLIAENIMENLTLPPPADLAQDLSANNPIMNYGWSTNEPHSSKALLDHDYNFPIDANSIGFLQDKSLFFENIPTNACDEIKAEYRNSQEDTSMLTHQMSIPSAPPEEDSKSDESGLDVHSIEQDAKKDFPLFEEFVTEPEFAIEPSETDDDKIEYREREKCSDDPVPDVDSFTNRVERFKKMETTTEVNDTPSEVRREIKTFEVPTSTSPAITIASYFDTGNYAVENHYRNSITSPTATTSFNSSTSNQMRIPPGFEEEYQRRLSGISSQDLACAINNQIATYIPDTTKKIPRQDPINADYESICDSKVVTMVEQLINEDVTPDEQQVLPDTTKQELPSFASVFQSDFKEKIPEKIEEVLPATSTQRQDANIASFVEPLNAATITENSENTSTYNDFSRLSSYFSSPRENSKSFFELSQSQDHYRHKSNDKTFDTIQNNVRSFFETATTQNENRKGSLANTVLMHELTSPSNIKPNDDAKIVNYFTVDYDNKNIFINEPINIDNKTNDVKSKDSDDDDVVNCKYCRDVTKIREITESSYKFRKSMDGNTDDRKEANTMNGNKESVGKKSMTVNFCDQTYQEEAEDKIVVMSENRSSPEYAPVKHHWFYQVDTEEKSTWRGFSVADSRALENAYSSPDLNENTLVATDGGRYDVNVMQRVKTAVYWEDKPTSVMRCSWFYKGTTDARYVPYSESIAEQLEEEYIRGMSTGEWHRRLQLPGSELVVMHGPAVMVHFLQSGASDPFTSSPLFPFGKRVYRNPPKMKVLRDQPRKIDHLVFLVHGAGEYSKQRNKIQSMMRPRVVRRGCVESEIEDSEPSSVDHLLLLCHGVGSACDMRFRPVEEVVDDFRATSLQLIQSHYKNSYDNGIVGRVEVLPISWHASLHSGQTGVDRRLAAVTLDSIPRLRNFTNDTILDVLFYTSPVFCQTIIDTVCSELNRIYSLFRSRNPDFKGGVSLGGHSLGSVILYDLLCHQMPKDIPLSKEKQFVTGSAGTGQPCVKYPSLDFNPDALYALGSPIAMFNCIRGVESLGQEFRLPTCKNFFNIFHPYDPIAYRIEPLINPQLRDVKPFLIPHHKGRKRMHLELKDTMARVGADIKQKLIESIRSTWSSMWKTQPPPDQQLEKVVEEEMEKEELNTQTKEESVQETEVTPEMLGKLNDGRRVDYVLQEAPLEMINEYLFAMRSHVCYWESEDTMLVMLREIYSALGVSPDSCLPQQTMTVQRNRLVHDDNDISPSECPSTSKGSS